MVSLTHDELIAVIRKGESETVEFKENFDKESIETVGAFANAKGGIVLVGVSDKGKVVGVQLQKNTINSWVTQIAQSSDPRMIPDMNVFTIAEKNVVTVSIKEYPIKPISIKGRCFRRVGNSNRIMTPQEIAQMHLVSTGISWDAFPARDITLKDIELKKVQAYIQSANRTGRRKITDKPLEVLKKLELITEDKISWAALLVFGMEPQRSLSQSAVHCGRFRKDKTVIIDDLMIETDLINQVDDVMKFITRNISVRFEFEGKPQRKNVWEYPLDALREAIINAIVHRDYTFSANVMVEIYDDHIQIWNPGMLLPGVTIEDLYKKDHKSVIRNKLIAQIFYDIGYIEKYGSGTFKIIDLCKQQGAPSPEFQERFGGFSITFRKDVYTEDYLHILGLNERQIAAVMYVKENGKITNKEYQKLTGVSKRTATRDLEELVRRDVAEQIGSTGKGTEYVLKRVDGAIKGP